MKIGKQRLQDYHINIFLIDLEKIILAYLNMRLNLINLGVIDEKTHLLMIGLIGDHLHTRI